MQLRWLEVEAGYPNAICLSGVCRILQVGHWEESDHYKDVDGRLVPVMELRWHDIPVEKP